MRTGSYVESQPELLSPGWAELASLESSQAGGGVELAGLHLWPAGLRASGLGLRRRRLGVLPYPRKEGRYLTCRKEEEEELSCSQL